MFIGHRFDQSIFLYKHLLAIVSPRSYTAKFVLDLLEIPKGKFYHDEVHMSKTMQLLILRVKSPGHNLHNLLLFYKCNKINAGILNDSRKLVLKTNKTWHFLFVSNL